MFRGVEEIVVTVKQWQWCRELNTNCSLLVPAHPD